MENYYSLLGVEKNASPQEVKKAFRARAKQLHPDIAGKAAEPRMRKLLAAYEALSRPDRRFEYDRVYSRFSKGFDYPSFLHERHTDPQSQAKLIFFLLLQQKEQQFDPLEIWTENGGLRFSMEKYLDREDWMDCAFLLAEELDRRGRVYEAFCLLAAITKEERRRPYFKHFTEDVECFFRELVRLRLKASVDPKQYISCLESLLSLGVAPKEESRILRSMAGVLSGLGEIKEAEIVLREAVKRDPGKKQRKKKYPVI